MADEEFRKEREPLRLWLVAVRSTRSGKGKVLSALRLYYERSKELLMLPRFYRINRANENCLKSRLGLALDLLTWFFSYRMLPVHYNRCRIWEADRKEWKYYFGSNYRPLHEARLRRTVWPVRYRVLFDDKYVCALLCQALGIRAPRTYGMLDPARNFRSQLVAWLDEGQGRLIVKPLRGQSGRDIVLAEREKDGTFIRSKQSRFPLEQFRLGEKAIVQEVLTQHPALAAFSSSSVNTLRVVTLLTADDRVIIVNSALRTGVGPSFVDNWAAGGVAAGVDRETGRLRPYAYDKVGRRYVSHPTSGIVFADYQIPGFKRICASAAAIQRLFPFYRMLGLDLALEPDGEPAVIEINYAPDFTFLEQTGGPVLRIEPVLRAFGEYGLLVNRHQRKLYKRLIKAEIPKQDGDYL
jgi:hypothetical protein